MKDIEIELIAQKAHEMNRRWCSLHGDNSKLSWDETDEIIKKSAISGIIYIMENPDTNPEQSHISWTKYKTDEGWVWGEEIDIDNKTHPCLVEYSLLPKEQKMKDSLFGLVVKTELGII